MRVQARELTTSGVLTGRSLTWEAPDGTKVGDEGLVTVQRTGEPEREMRVMVVAFGDAGYDGPVKPFRPLPRRKIGAG